MKERYFLSLQKLTVNSKRSCLQEIEKSSYKMCATYLNSGDWN